MSIVDYKEERIKIVILEPVSEKLINYLKNDGFNVVRTDEILEIEDADIVIIRSRTKVDNKFMEKAKKLKIIARAGNGIDNIDFKAIRSDVKIINTPEASVQSVAELTIAMILIGLRRICYANYLMRKRTWKRVMGKEFYGKTLGIIGFGRIGSKVAELAKIFGVRILVYDKRDVHKKAELLGVEVVDLDYLLRNSDVITIHVNLNNDSYHLIDREEFEKMKDGVILINTSRGAVINTKVLLDYVKNGKIGFVALDTLENEPPKEDWEFELIQMPNVLITPHIGASTIESQERIAIELYKKIKEALL